MTYAPTSISGPIIPQSNGSSTALPGITQSAFFGGAGVTASGLSRELYTRAPYGVANISGITADYASQMNFYLLVQILFLDLFQIITLMFLKMLNQLLPV